MIVTTLNRIRAHQPCADGWGKLLKHLGKTKADDEMLPFAVILESNVLADALWCCRVEPQYAREWRLFAVWCARQVQHLIADRQHQSAIDVAERYANGLATDDELKTARDAARDTARDAVRDAAMDAARDAAKDVASDVAWAAAKNVAWNAALSAAWDGVRDYASDAAWGGVVRDGAWFGVRDGALDAAMAAQSREFLRVVTETEAIMAVKAKND